MKRFLIIVNNKSFLDSHRQNLVEKIHKDFQDTHLVTTDKDDHKTLSSLPGVNGVLNYFSLLINLLFKKNYDVIHVISPKAILLFMLFNYWRRNHNVVLSFSGFGWIRQYFLGFKKIIGLTIFKVLFFRFSGQIIVQNKFDQSLCERFGVASSQVNLIKGSGFDFNAAKAKNLIGKPLPKETVFLFASRLLASKGVMKFCYAAKTISALYPEIKFLIAGQYDPSNLSSIKKSDFDHINAAPYLEYLGHVDDVNALITRVTSVVLPSTYGEGLPKILIEAAALGRIIITNDHPGCVDAVVHNETGFICALNNQKELENYMIKTHLDKKMAKQMSQKAFEFASDNFDVEGVIRQHFEIYNRVLHG